MTVGKSVRASSVFCWASSPTICFFRVLRADLSSRL